MTRMLGWSLRVLISYEGDSDQQIFLNFKAFYCVRKKVFRVFVTSISSDIIFSFLARLFFSFIYFSQREPVLQSARTSCYQRHSFHLNLQNIFSFLRRDTQKFLCLVKANLFLAVCYYHVTYVFESGSALYSLPECQGTPCSRHALCLKFK